MFEDLYFDASAANCATFSLLICYSVIYSTICCRMISAYSGIVCTNFYWLVKLQATLVLRHCVCLKVKRVNFLWETDFKVTERYLSYGITQCYLLHDTSERPPSAPVRRPSVTLPSHLYSTLSMSVSG